MLTTVATYCTERQVTRQFVYRYIREGKFKTVELPTFTRHNGQEIAIGVQKFLEVPDAFTEKTINKKLLTKQTESETERLDYFVQYMTDSPLLEAHYRTLLSEKDPSVRKALKAKMYADINAQSESDRIILLQQLDVLNARLMTYMKTLRSEIKEIMAT
jgi:hypothetical protein